ncbi:MAG: Kelch repeat-containing protein [Verrucomicrobiia bacterium]
MKTELLSMGAVLAVCLGSSADLKAAESLWASQAPLPAARFGPTTCAVDGKIYAMGGGDSVFTPFLPDVDIYDPATDSWRAGIPMPNERMGHAAAMVGGKIYVMGGAYEFQTSTDAVDEYDPATGVWRTRAPMPRDRVLHCAGAVDGKIYVFGGSQYANHVNMRNPPAVDVYDPATDTWTEKGRMRSPRTLAAAAVVNGKIYAFGGIAAADISRAPVSTTDVYDPATDTWRPLAGLVARAGSGVCAVDNKIYVMGGGSYLQGSLSRTDIYDPATDTWQPGPKLSKAKYFMGASFVGGRIYIVGGSDAGSGLPWQGIATVEAYTPPPGLCITRQGGSITLSWTGILQELNGQVGWQWRDVLSLPTSPWTIEAAQQNPMNCFRSRLP